MLAIGHACGFKSFPQHSVVPHCAPEHAALLYFPAAQLVHATAPPPLIVPAGQGKQETVLGAGA
jgi:hypothetical protein